MSFRFESEICKDCARNTAAGCITVSEAEEPLLDAGYCSFRTEDYHKVMKELDDSITYSKKKGISRKALGRLEMQRSDVQREYEKMLTKCYEEDKHRGSGGGNSNDSCSNRAIKQLMKDNRDRDTKWTTKERQEYTKAVQEWEQEHGKLPKHQPNDGITRRKTDSYTDD